LVAIRRGAGEQAIVIEWPKKRMLKQSSKLQPIVSSHPKVPKKLIVAGPGAEKTYLFGQLLKYAEGTQDQRLVLTFIKLTLLDVP
jgi:hypothetical protein